REEREVEEFLRGSTREVGCARCADRVNGGSSWRLGEQGVEVTEILVQFLEPARVDGRSSAFDGQGQLRLSMFELTFEDLTGAGDGVSLVVEEALDAESHFDVAATV